MTKENQIKKVGFLGLGLIGGSLAKAFREKADVRDMVAVDTDEKAGEAALQDGVITAFSTPAKGYEIFDGCDLVVIGTPVDFFAEALEKLNGLSIGIISDVGSVKSEIMNRKLPSNFLGGHPMAGSERHGYLCARADLFENAVYVLCVGEHCTVPAALLRAFEELIKKIGANPVYMEAKEHDARVAAISHLPHLAASALSLLAAKRDDGYLSVLAAGGFRDITRIASSDPELWTGISMASSEELLPILKDYIEILKDVENHLKNRAKKEVHAFFSKGAFYRNNLPTGGRGALEASASLTVYLEDKPGALADITALLSVHNINIKNMNIRNYRTYEGGQLLLLLGDSSQAAYAYSLLKEAGYECD